MALTHSTMVALGSPLPSFRLPDVISGQPVSSDGVVREKGLLVMFICRHCPYVVHVKEELARLGRDYEQKNIGIIAISSNDATHYHEDRPEKLKAMALNLGFTFPLCYDETQNVAKAFTAACTPDFFLFDQCQRLVYRGQLDESRPGNGHPVTGKDVRAALDALLHDQPVARNQQPSAGCNIKWKPGREPDYA